MSTDTEIDDPAALDKAGSGAQELGGQTRTAGSHPDKETRSASRDFGSGHWDGGLGGALTSLAETWAGQVFTLAYACENLAHQCGSSGSLYQGTETANTQTMRSLSSEPSPFG